MSRGSPLYNGHLLGRIPPKKNIFCWLKLNKKVEIERVKRVWKGFWETAHLRLP